MPYNPRSGQPAAGSVGPAQLQAAAVTAGKIATGAIDSNVLFASGVVDAAAIGSLQVTTAKLADNAVSIAKSVAALGRKTIQDSEALLTQTGPSRKRLERITISKQEFLKAGQVLIVVSGKISVAGTATFEAWLNNDADWSVDDLYTGSGTAAAVQTLTSTTYGLVTLAIDTSGLALDQKHVINLAAFADAAGKIVSTDLRQYFADPVD